MLPPAPGVVVIPAGNPITKGVLEDAGIEVIEAEVSGLMRGGGSVHCMTGLVKRGEGNERRSWS